MVNLLLGSCVRVRNGLDLYLIRSDTSEKILPRKESIVEDRLKNWLKALKLNESAISMLLGALVVVVIGVLVYNYFTAGKKPAETTTTGGVELVEENGELVPSALPATHTVAEGEHLWSIAETYYGSGYNWVDIANENNIRYPNWLVVGQSLNIPRTPVIQPALTLVATPSVIEGTSYTVAKGDSLWTIAVRSYQDGYRWPDIAKANADKLSDPDQIEVGMVLTLPR